jgi:two-component system, sensor histidine kinase and response regulator
MTTPEPVKILVVDDLEENLMALEAVLREEAVEPVRARSGPEALELLLVHDFALAVIDVHMPQMDGFELAELMRGTERTRQVPIVFVTASPDEPHRVFRGYDAGAVDFLIKPIEPRILRHKVRTFVELHAHKRQLRRQLEELEAVSDTLAETLRLNETFVAAVGHDLRSPLAAITVAVGLLDAKVTDPEVRRIVGRVDSSIRRFGAILDLLDDLARIRLGGGLDLVRDHADLGAIVAEVVREIAMAVPKRVIAVEQTGDRSGRWDGVRLARVAANLIRNAVQHGDPGAPVEVRVDGSAADSVRLSVCNGGVIAQPVLARIFEPFRRGDGRATRGSLGLGLYIVHEIARAHGGAITVRSTPADGTCFEVHLPRDAA